MNTCEYQNLTTAPVRAQSITFKSEDYSDIVLSQSNNYVLLTGRLRYQSELPGCSTYFTVAKTVPTMLSLVTYTTDDSTRGYKLSGVCKPEVTLTEEYIEATIYTYFSDYGACRYAKNEGFHFIWDHTEHTPLQVAANLTRIRANI